MNPVAGWLVAHARPCLAASLLLTVVLGVFASRIRVDSTIESVFPAGDPELAFYERARETFGGDDIGVIGVQAQDLFAAQTLAKIARVTEAVARVPGVERVLSVTNAVDPFSEGAEPARLLGEIPPPPEAIEALQQRLRSTPLYGANLIASDARGAAITVFFAPLTDAEARDRHIDERIRAILAEEYGSFSYTGPAYLKRAAVDMMRDDLLRLTPVALGVVALVLWVSFWSIRGVVLPLLSVGCALLWTLGVMVLLGKGITLGTFVLVPLLAVLGSSYGIHVMARYDEQVRAGVAGEAAIVAAWQRVWLPLVVSASTMAIGIGSLALNRIASIHDLGVGAVVGLVCLTVTSLTVIPALLSLLGTSRRRRTSVVAPRLMRVLAALGERAYAWRRPILWAAAAAVAVGVAGMRLIQVDADFLAYFDPASQVRRDNEVINREIAGSNPFSLVIEGDAPGTLRRRRVLRRITGLQEFLATLPGVTSSISVADYLEALAARHAPRRDGGASGTPDADAGAPEGTGLWDDPARVAAAVRLIEANPDAFKSVVTADFQRANVLVRTTLSSSRAVEETLRRIDAHVAAHFPATLRVRPTGNLVLLSGNTSDIVAGQIRGIALAFGVILLLMAFLFLSVKVGLLAVLPNLIPIVVFFGTVGAAGIYLDLGTSLIAVIALGMAVDATIHYMARLNLELQGETEQRTAVIRTLQAVGPPIVYTAVAVCAGFLAFAGASVVPIQHFGLLTSLTVAAALAATLVVLPALLATTKVITAWDLAAIELGDDPAGTIPLFSGLRPNEARIVALMGRRARYAAGEAIVRQGEVGHEMYVIIHGHTQVFAGAGSDRTHLLDLRRGDVFGEMALVRQRQRTADVVAGEAVEVLAVDERFLDRLQRRYPRIAARVFLNLTRILSDRLERMTERFVTLS